MSKLSLVIPTLDEEENIKPLVLEISNTLEKNYEIIFIDYKSRRIQYLKYKYKNSFER